VIDDDQRALSPHEARRIAAEACVHDATVRRYFARLPIRSTTRARIEAALNRLALARPEPGVNGGADR